MKGIVLAGGTGSRLWPMTIPTSKQLLPIYDKPLIYHPISTLMLAGIRVIQIITTPHDQPSFQKLLSYGEDFGIEISYAVQQKPEGLAQAFLISEKFINGHNCALILGDNIFNSDFQEEIGFFNEMKNGAQIFAYKVRNPSEYGVVTFNEIGLAIDIEEKPIQTLSPYAVPGLYFYDQTVTSRARCLKPSKRGELEITDLNRSYLLEGLLRVKKLPEGSAWLDTGTFEALNDAANYVRVLEERQGQKIGCLEEIAWRKKWIDDEQLAKSANKFNKNNYGKYLLSLLES